MRKIRVDVPRMSAAGVALAVLLLALAMSARAQGFPATRQIAANESPAGTMMPGASLGGPGAAMGGPGAAMAPQGAEPKIGEPGAAMAPQDGKMNGDAKMQGEGMGDAPSVAETNEQLLYEHTKPTRVRISIVNATGQANGAAKVAVLLGEYQRRPLEDKMGLKIELANLSTGYDRTQAPVVVFYRPGYLRAALLLAQAIPGDTMVTAMRPQVLKRSGVDVEVVVGEALP